MPNSRGPRFQRIIHTCKVMFLFIVCDMFSSIAYLKCPIPAAAFSQHIHPLFPLFALCFLFFLPDEVALSEVAVLGSCEDASACAPPAIKQIQAPPTKITTRVKAQQHRAKRTPSLQEAIRDSDPAVTDQHLEMEMNTQP